MVPAVRRDQPWPHQVRHLLLLLSSQEGSGQEKHSGLSKRLPWVTGGSRPSCSELRGCGERVNGDGGWTLLPEVWLLGL